MQDYNFGTLVRPHSESDYGPNNSFFVTRFEFLCIEIARNKEGLNKHLIQAGEKGELSKEEKKELEIEMRALEEKISARLS